MLMVIAASVIDARARWTNRAGAMRGCAHDQRGLRACALRVEAQLLTIVFRFEWNPAHDCVNPKNGRDSNTIALCDIAPPPKRIAPQSLSSNLTDQELQGFAQDFAK
jgi:hypothetical protein